MEYVKKRFCDTLFYVNGKTWKWFMHCSVTSEYYIVNYTIISCSQVNSTDFVHQIVGKCISASLGFQNFFVWMPRNPWLSFFLPSFHAKIPTCSKPIGTPVRIVFFSCWKSIHMLTKCFIPGHAIYSWIFIDAERVFHSHSLLWLVDCLARTSCVY